jgi:putative transposase
MSESATGAKISLSKLTNRFGLLAVEALMVRSMIKNPRLAKSIADASWSMFFSHLLDKAEEAGRVVVRVNPAFTSQTCSTCGHCQPLPLSVRVYDCPVCGLVLHRDHNGSLNILADGLQAVGRHSRVIPKAPAREPWGVVTIYNSSLHLERFE